MTMTLTVGGKRRLTRIANEYRDKGYRVIVHPGQDDLPAFLRGFEPAMIAIGDDESVVLEIRTREQLSDRQNSLVALASAVENRPGWRLELVSTGTKYVEAEVPPGEEPDVHEIRARIGSARELYGEGQVEDAALIAGAAAEATLRRVARINDVELDHLQPGFILRQLYSLGLLDEQHYHALRRGIVERNVISHGFRPNTAVDDWVLPLIHATSELLTESVG